MKTGQNAQNMQDMENSELHEFFIEELKDIYWAEKHLVKNLPKMVKSATSAKLKDAIQSHLEETEGQVKRLEEVFQSLGERANAVKCEAMAGLVEEAERCVKDTEDGTMVRDAAIIACAQKVEHYEIASYGTLKTLANLMGHQRAVSLLEATLNEEKNADEILTAIAEGYVNEKASRETK